MTSDDIVLMDYLDKVPDPRHARGKQHEWRVILVIICAALVSGHKKVSAIAHWAVLHASEIIAALGLSVRRLPSLATFYRALRKVDIGALERQCTAFSQAVKAQDPVNGLIRGLRGRGQAVDGKTLRGASAHGETAHLVSLVRHGSGCSSARNG